METGTNPKAWVILAALVVLLSGMGQSDSSAKSMMYWTDLANNKIQRANLDGSGIRDLITTGLGNPQYIALDTAAGKMYWTDSGLDMIRRANLNGSQIEALVTTGLSSPGGIALDVEAGKMYWTDALTHKIQRANLNGNGVEDLITTGLQWPKCIALDVTGGKMYWADPGTDKIQRANLDGSGVEDLFNAGSSALQGIALDVSAGKMYWADLVKIQRANLDGSDIEFLVTTGGRLRGIALDIAAGKMYWTDTLYYGKIQCANLDGSGVKDLIVGGMNFPIGLALDVPKPPKIIYVDGDAGGANNGSSWADAYNYLQNALTVASSGDEIRVAQGIYKPDRGGGNAPGNRYATFRLKNGVAVKGGYAGFGEADPNARDIEVYETILSGDLAGNDVDVSDPCDLLDELSRGENSHHVVTGSGTDETAVLDGFTITAGNAKGSGYGGGIYNHSGIPTLMNCTFTRNSAEFFGGAVYYQDSSSPTLINCTFNENSAMSGGGICESTSSLILKQCLFNRNWASSGGGMSSIRSMPKLIQCTFSGNSAYRGGGISTDESSPMITNSIFSGNSAHRGGVMVNLGSSVTLTNCIFSGNSAIIEGGAVYNQGGYVTPLYMVEGGNLTLTNCTFAGNSAVDGNAIACDSMTQVFPSELQVTNCILWDGGSEIWNNDGSMITLTYSDVWGGWPGIGNIEVDPCFVAHGHWEPPPPPPPVFKASEPNPADGAIGVSTTADLSWTAGHDAVSHDVYFGTSSVPPFTGNQTSITFDPGTMDYITTYYWRIDEVNDSGKTAGDIWSFTTFMSPPLPPPLLTLAASYMSDTKKDIWIEGDYHLLPDSPCIDAGDPNYIAGPNETDLDGRPRVIGGRIDMGVYEFFNTPPVGDAGDDQVVECACNTTEGTKVTLDGSGSYDADGDSLTYTWTGPFLGSPAHGPTPTVTLEAGCPDDYVITLIVNDGTEDSEPNEVTITVVDTTPPDFELSVKPTTLWPPDHKMYEITPSWTVSDDCVPTPDVMLVSIAMSEADDIPGGGNTSDDIQIGEDGSIYLRSERSGTGSDRVYTITYQAVDDSGNAAVGSANVSIPHDFKVLARIGDRWLWSNPSGRIPEDLNGDGIVNLVDFASFAENWIK